MPNEIEILPKSRVIRVRAEYQFVLPAPATREEIEEWVRMETHIGSSIENSNPLVNEGIEIISGEVVLTDTGLHQHESISAGEKPGSWYTHHDYRAEPYVGPSAIEQIMARDRDKGAGK